MSNLGLNLLLYLASFLIVWVGSGLIVSAITKLSHRLHLPTFLVSFVILGFLTSTPEIAVGISAIASHTPSIFIGNLLGGIPILFFLIIPILAIFGHGIKLNHGLSQGGILLALVVSLAPFITILDHQISNQESGFLVITYLITLFLLYHHRSGHSHLQLHLEPHTLFDLFQILLGTLLVLFSSHLIVKQTLYFSQAFNIAPFYVSLILLSLGTNLPELTLAIRAILAGKKDIAFGDYLGSAAANVLLLGIFSLFTKDNTLSVDNFLSMFILVSFGLLLFFYFARTKHTISPKEGLLLLVIYLLFVTSLLT